MCVNICENMGFSLCFPVTFALKLLLPLLPSRCLSKKPRGGAEKHVGSYSQRKNKPCWSSSRNDFMISMIVANKFHASSGAGMGILIHPNNWCASGVGWAWGASSQERDVAKSLKARLHSAASLAKCIGISPISSVHFPEMFWERHLRTNNGLDTSG